MFILFKEHYAEMHLQPVQGMREDHDREMKRMREDFASEIQALKMQLQLASAEYEARHAADRLEIEALKERCESFVDAEGDIGVLKERDDVELSSLIGGHEKVIAAA